MKDDFQENGQIFGSWKTWRSHGKGRGKSLNLKSSKKYEPCPPRSSLPSSAHPSPPPFYGLFGMVSNYF